MLWLQAFFYTMLCYVLACFISPDLFGIKNLLHAVLPVTFSNYWYLTAYFCLFFLAPALNFLVNNMPEKQLKRIIIACMFLFSIMPTFSMKDMFNIKFGYDFVWITFLYLLGAYFRKYDVLERIKLKKAIFIYLLSVLISWGFRMAIEFITAQILGKAVYGILLFQYVSPTVIISAIMLLAVFSKIKIKTGTEQVVKFLTPLVFGVYLIHENKYVRPIIEYFVKDFGNLSPIVLPFAVIGAAILIYLLCTAIEFLRHNLFKVLKIKELVLKAENHL